MRPGRRKLFKVQQDLHALYHSLLELGGGCHEPVETIYGRVGLAESTYRKGSEWNQSIAV